MNYGGSWSTQAIPAVQNARHSRREYPDSPARVRKMSRSYLGNIGYRSSIVLRVSDERKYRRPIFSSDSLQRRSLNKTLDITRKPPCFSFALFVGHSIVFFSPRGPSYRSDYQNSPSLVPRSALSITRHAFDSSALSPLPLRPLTCSDETAIGVIGNVTTLIGGSFVFSLSPLNGPRVIKYNLCEIAPSTVSRLCATRFLLACPGTRYARGGARA